jgi:hypothetical protein
VDVEENRAGDTHHTRNDTMNMANQSSAGYIQMQGAQAQAAAQPKQEGLFTQRIRSMAGQAEDHEYRLRSLLRTLRVPPPEPPLAGSSGLAQVHTTIEEHLNRHDTAQGNIGALISELEGLLA